MIHQIFLTNASFAFFAFLIVTYLNVATQGSVAGWKVGILTFLNVWWLGTLFAAPFYLTYSIWTIL